MTPTYQPIGDIVKMHGLKGHVVVQMTEPLTSLETVPYIFIKIGHAFVPYQVEEARLQGKQAIFKLQDIDTYMAGHALIGKNTWLPAQQLIALKKENTSYPFFLMGYQVIDQQQGPLGIVEGIEKFPMNSCLVIIYQEKELLIPFQETFIQHLNHDKKQLFIKLPEGFLEALGHERPLLQRLTL